MSFTNVLPGTRLIINMKWFSYADNSVCNNIGALEASKWRASVNCIRANWDRAIRAAAINLHLLFAPLLLAARCSLLAAAALLRTAVCSNNQSDLVTSQSYQRHRFITQLVIEDYSIYKVDSMTKLSILISTPPKWSIVNHTHFHVAFSLAIWFLCIKPVFM